MSHETLVVFQLLRASFEMIFNAFVCVELTDNYRLKGKVIRFVIPVCLMYLGCINNITEGPFNPFIFSISFMALSAFIVNKDGLKRKILILLSLVLPGIILLFWQELLLYIGGYVSSYNLVGMPDSDAILEHQRNYSEMIICNFLLLIVIFRKKYRRIHPAIPLLIVLLLSLFETSMIFPVFSLNLMKHRTYVAIICAITTVMVTALVILIRSFYDRSSKLRAKERESIIIQTLTDFDREYYDMVREQIEETSMLRHDAVNYIEQISGLIASSDENGKSSAIRLIDELEMKLM